MLDVLRELDTGVVLFLLYFSFRLIEWGLRNALSNINRDRDRCGERLAAIERKLDHHITSCEARYKYKSHEQ